MANIYKHHLFFCTHARKDDTACCQQHNALDLRNYAKQRVKDLKLKQVRVNTAGCLTRCVLGPILVIYPEETWYQYQTEADIDEIIESHLQNNTIVERLKR